MAFAIFCDIGFAVAVVTHEISKLGSLIWVAGPTFDEEPTVKEVRSIDHWRWCIFFPTAAALRRRLVVPIGEMGIPTALQQLPVMRSGDKRRGWQIIEFLEDGLTRPIGPATDPGIPIYQIVNEMTHD